jgi:hypothetical protein
MPAEVRWQDQPVVGSLPEQAAGGMMVYLGNGTPGRRRTQLRLHDAPPGYQPPRVRPEDARRQLRQEVTVLRVAMAVAVLLVAALVVTCLVVIATRL